MKKIILRVVILSSLVLLGSYKFATTYYLDVLTTVGLNKATVDQNIFGTITSGLPTYSRPGNLAQLLLLSGVDKTALTNEAGAYVKNYCNSQEFKKKYEDFRQSKKPHVAQLSEEEREMQLELIAQQEEMYTPEVLDMLPADARKNALDDLENMKAAANGKLSDEQLKKWEEVAPANPNIAIKKVLQNFLIETKDVDFSATTFTQDNKKKFSNPSYEKKNYQWKACYRSGKEVTETSRKFAQQWLTELN